MALVGVETERKSTTEHLRIQQELILIISELFNTEVKTVKFYHNKESHGDCDLLILNNDNLGNIGEILKAKFGPTYCNNNVYSFAYDNYQIDIIPTPLHNWGTAQCFFNYDPSGNLQGKISHKFGLKYGFSGLVFPFRGFSGHQITDIIISKDNRKIFNFLGFDYDRYLLGFDTVEDIFKYVIESKYFDYTIFDFDNLNHIDRKRNRKRATYNGFLEYLTNHDITYSYNFHKDKSLYIDIINDYFPEANLKIKLKELSYNNNKVKLASKKFNGEMIIEWSGKTGIELGKIIFNYKKYIENKYNMSFNDYLLLDDNSADKIKLEFLNWYKQLNS